MSKLVVLWMILVPVGMVFAATGERPSGAVNPVRCATCHTEVKAFEDVHAPVAANGCGSCHRIKSAAEHTYELVAQGAALCRNCHDHTVADAPVVHAPVEEGECMTCHHPHGGPDRKFLRSASVVDLCESCHGDVGGAGHVHAPVKAGDCGACHQPHSSNEAMLLLDKPRAVCVGCHESVRTATASAVSRHDAGCATCHAPHASEMAGLLPTDPTSLCFGCHDREIALPEGGKLSNVKLEIESGTHPHGPVADGDCSSCHVNHGSPHFRLLAETYPSDFYASFSEGLYALCFTCHDEDLVRVASTTTATEFRNGSTNLHYVHVNREKKGRTCRACHDIHAGNDDKLIRDSVPFGRGSYRLSIGYESTPDGGRCSTGCHEPLEYDRNVPEGSSVPVAAATP
jgi:predicted CXXCH cytochrome family protein